MEEENKFQALYDQGLEEDYTINQIEEALTSSDVSINQAGKYFNLSGDNPVIMKKSSIVDLVKDYYSNIDNVEKEKWKERLYHEIEKEVIESINPSLYILFKDKTLKYGVQINSLEINGYYISESNTLKKIKHYDLSIEELNLSVRSYNCLNSVDIKTVGDLIFWSEHELSEVRSLGRKSLKEIKEVLSDLEMSLGMYGFNPKEPDNPMIS